MGEAVEERVGYLVTRAQYALRSAMDTELRAHGITTPQYAALSALEQHGVLSGAELARRCFVTPQTMNAIVANLAGAELVTRRPHPKHGRVIEISLAPLARSLLRKAHATVRAIEEAMLHGMSTQGRRKLARRLRHCIETLETRPRPKLSVPDSFSAANRDVVALE